MVLSATFKRPWYYKHQMSVLVDRLLHSVSLLCSASYQAKSLKMAYVFFERGEDLLQNGSYTTQSSEIVLQS